MVVGGESWPQVELRSDMAAGLEADGVRQVELQILRIGFFLKKLPGLEC